jgi:hypothetical protein
VEGQGNGGPVGIAACMIPLIALFSISLPNLWDWRMDQQRTMLRLKVAGASFVKAGHAAEAQSVVFERVETAIGLAEFAGAVS